MCVFVWGRKCWTFCYVDLLCYIFQAPNLPPKTPCEADDATLPVWKRPGSFRSRGADGRLEQSLNKPLSLRKSFSQTEFDLYHRYSRGTYYVTLVYGDYLL